MFEPLCRHDRAVLCFSGGKDSLACLHMLRPFWAKITVLWANTGDAFPETIALMERVRSGVPRFIEVPSDQPTHIRDNGYPVDLIPVSATAFGRIIKRTRGPTMHGSPVCCNANIWAPLNAAIKEMGATLVIRGTRQEDTRRDLAVPGIVIDGVEHAFPLWDWTSQRVKDYLLSIDELPEHYAHTETSLDCMHCTAYLDENARKMRWMAEKHPDVSREVQKRLRQIREAIRYDVTDLEKAIIS